MTHDRRCRPILPLLSAALPLVATVVVGCASENRVVVGIESVVSYTLSCRKPDGSFGPHLQPYGGPDWTAHAALTLHDAGTIVPDASPCSTALESSLPDTGTATESDLDRIDALTALDAPLPHEVPEHILETQRSDGWWPGPNGEPSLGATCRAVRVLDDAGRAPRYREAAAKFIVARLYPDGHFDETPRPKGAVSGAVEDSAADAFAPAGHILLTARAVDALTRLGYEIPWRGAVRNWVRACQRSDGGFGWRPGDAGGESDIWYTELAVSALRRLDAVPRDSAACARFINSCQNADGGFGDRPGWPSRLASTDYAIRAAVALGGKASSVIVPKSVPMPDERPPARWKRLHVFDLYAGPLPGPLNPQRRRPWSPGVPMFRVIGGIDTLTGYLAEPGLSVGDSSVTNLGWQIPMPAYRTILADGDTVDRSTVLLLPGGAGRDTIDAVRESWRECLTAKPSDLQQPSFDALTDRGALVVEALPHLSRADLYLAEDELMRDSGTSTAVAVAESDGTDLVREQPDLERLAGVMPTAVLLSTDARRDRARMMWLGEKGNFDEFSEAFAAGRAACVVRVRKGSVDAAIYGPSNVRESLRERRSALVW